MTENTAKKILKINNESYNQIANHFSVTRRYIWPELKTLARYIKPGQTVLDIGCGNGRLLEELESKNIHYFGIDNSKKLIDIARERYNLNPLANFAVFDIFHLPFSDNFFDAVFAIAVINHIPTKKLQKKALKILNDKLKPQGLLLMTNWNLWQLNWRKKNWFYYQFKKLCTSSKIFADKYSLPKKELGIKDIITEWKSGEKKYPLYYHAFTLKEINNLLQESGFEILDFYYSKKGERVNIFQGENIVSIARKI